MSEKIDLSTDGSCIISEEVIATIASNAALEVPGVAAMASRPRDIRGVVRIGATRSVAVFNNADRTVIDVYLSPLMTAHVPTVAEQVQEAVKNAVQAMTGSPVTRVNVHVARPLEAVASTEQKVE